MADDINPALRAEYNAALEILMPQLRGLHDLALVSLSADAKTEINAQIVARERRESLIRATLAELDQAVVARTALEADGYPMLPTEEVVGAVFTEMQGERTDLEIALDLFVPEAAQGISIALGTPASKT